MFSTGGAGGGTVCGAASPVVSGAKYSEPTSSCVPGTNPAPGGIGEGVKGGVSPAAGAAAVRVSSCRTSLVRSSSDLICP